MAILNVTPDSVSDGGHLETPRAAVEAGPVSPTLAPRSRRGWRVDAPARRAYGDGAGEVTV